MAPPLVNAPCGTLAGYDQHHRRKVPVCTDCQRVKNDYDAARRLATGEGRGLWIDREVLFQLAEIPDTRWVLARHQPRVIAVLDETRRLMTRRRARAGAQ